MNYNGIFANRPSRFRPEVKQAAVRFFSLLSAFWLATAVFVACSSFDMRILKSEPDFASARISAIGDIMVHGPQIYGAFDPSCPCYDFWHSFSEVQSYFERSDLTIGNLETTLPGRADDYTGYPQFGAPDALVEAAKRAGIDMLTLANNHTVDKGRHGITRTIEVVDALGFHHLGSYDSAEDYEQRRILTLNINDIEFAFLNYTYGTNGIPVPSGQHVNLIEPDLIAEDIEMAREIADVVVVLYHYGAEYIRLPDQYQIDKTDHAFEMGADIVIGGHPHVLQPFEVFHDFTDRYERTSPRLVAYSLGNYVSNQQRRYTDGGKIFNFTVRLNQEGEISYHDIDFDPIWVYVDRSGERPKHRVIPVDEYLDNEGRFSLPQRAFDTMMVFYNDTMEHLGPYLEMVTEPTEANH